MALFNKKPAKRPQATRKRAKATKGQTASTLKASLSLQWGKIALVGLIVIPLFSLVGGYQWIQDPRNLTIKSVEVAGDWKVLDKESLQPAIEKFTKTNLFLLDTKSLEKELEKNPWVHSASITHKWPDKLIVKIHEQKPVALWGEEAMLAENGEIIKAKLPANKLPTGRDSLPLLFSPNDKGRNMASGFLKIRRWMKGFPLKVVEFKEDMRGSWQVKLENGMVLKIGREHHQKRLRRFMVGYKQNLEKVIDTIKVIDLRYTNGFAVKWKKGLSRNL